MSLRALVHRLDRLAARASNRPWKADTTEHVGENWMIGSVIMCGSAEDADGAKYSDWIVTTDRIHASEFNGEGAAADAAFIAELANAWPALREAALAHAARTPHSIDTETR